MGIFSLPFSKNKVEYKHLKNAGVYHDRKAEFTLSSSKAILY